MQNHKHSRQRDSILAFLAATDAHPTADTVYGEIRRTHPQISLGTVYRNLALLADLGRIRRLTPGDGKEHFDGKTEPHDHFICTCCGKIGDLPQEEISYGEVFPELPCGGRIERHSTFFYGLCGDCAGSTG